MTSFVFLATLFSRVDLNKLNTTYGYVNNENEMTLVCAIGYLVPICQMSRKLQTVKHSGPAFWHIPDNNDVQYQYRETSGQSNSVRAKSLIGAAPW